MLTHCAICGKVIFAFANQLEWLATAKPEDVVHGSCKVKRDGVVPAFWHCRNCDHPLEPVLLGWSHSWPSDERSDIRGTTCPLCDAEARGEGDDQQHALKMLYRTLRPTLKETL